MPARSARAAASAGRAAASVSAPRAHRVDARAATRRRAPGVDGSCARAAIRAAPPAGAEPAAMAGCIQDHAQRRLARLEAPQLRRTPASRARSLERPQQPAASAAARIAAGAASAPGDGLLARHCVSTEAAAPDQAVGGRVAGREYGRADGAAPAAARSRADLLEARWVPFGRRSARRRRGATVGAAAAGRQAAVRRHEIGPAVTPAAAGRGRRRCSDPRGARRHVPGGASRASGAPPWSPFLSDIDPKLLSQLRIGRRAPGRRGRPPARRGCGWRWPAWRVVVPDRRAAWWLLAPGRSRCRRPPRSPPAAAAAAPAGAVLQATGYVTARRQATVSTQITGTLDPGADRGRRARREGPGPRPARRQRRCAPASRVAQANVKSAEAQVATGRRRSSARPGRLAPPADAGRERHGDAAVRRAVAHRGRHRHRAARRAPPRGRRGPGAGRAGAGELRLHGACARRSPASSPSRRRRSARSSRRSRPAAASRAPASARSSTWTRSRSTSTSTSPTSTRSGRHAGRGGARAPIPTGRSRRT